MLTPRQRGDIRMRHARCRDVLADTNRPDAGFISASARDVPALLDELERLDHDLADCWVLLDYLARHCPDGPLKPLGDQAVQVLRRQHVPGWKGDPS